MKPEKTFETEMQAYVDSVVKSLPKADRKLQKIKTGREKENSLGLLKEKTVKG